MPYLPYREFLQALAAATEPECPICKDELTSPYKTRCKHTFCADCLKSWLHESSECPCCRRRLWGYIPSVAAGDRVGGTQSVREEDENADVSETGSQKEASEAGSQEEEDEDGAVSEAGSQEYEDGISEAGSQQGEEESDEDDLLAQFQQRDIDLQEQNDELKRRLRAVETTRNAAEAEIERLQGQVIRYTRDHEAMATLGTFMRQLGNTGSRSIGEREARD